MCRKFKHIDIGVVADDVNKQKVDDDDYEEEKMRTFKNVSSF